MPINSPPALDDARLDGAFELVARQVRDGRASYAGLAVARSDGLVRAASFDSGGEKAEAPRSAIASITKPIVATAVMQLVEEGSLVLLEPIETYVPGFRPSPPPETAHAPEPVTAWHVLTHTSGLPTPPDEHYAGSQASPGSLLRWLGQSTLRFAPGTAYSYTSESFYTLSAAIERLSGVSFAGFLRDRIFGPLGMDATTFDPNEPGPALTPIEGDFGPSGSSWEEVLPVFIGLTMPGGGLWSTPSDIARFGRTMLLDGTLDGTRILGRAFVDFMTRHHTAGILERDTGRPASYALGWGRPGLGRGSPAGRSSFGHSGASGSILIVDPDHDLVVVYLRTEWGATSTATDQAVQAVYAALS